MVAGFTTTYAISFSYFVDDCVLLVEENKVPGENL
jgi:hypothetical protein